MEVLLIPVEALIAKREKSRLIWTDDLSRNFMNGKPSPYLL